MPLSDFLLEFGRLRSCGLGIQDNRRGKFPLPMWFGTLGTRMQFTEFVDVGGANGARYRLDLLSGEFFFSHGCMMEGFADAGCSISLMGKYFVIHKYR